MIIYLTFGEYASGIFSSQVVDTCKELSFLSNQKIKIISVIHLKNFFRERKKLKSTAPDIIVLPAFPMMKNYKLNLFLLSIVFIFFRPIAVICRNAIPCKLGLMMRSLNFVKVVVFDGRAAESEQFVEYKLSEDRKFIEEIFKIEREAVHLSDFRIAVSDELVRYWRCNFGYTKDAYVVIPCTINSQHLASFVNTKINSRIKLGYNIEDIVLVYSGSISQWQSFGELICFFEEQIINNSNIKILFLCKKTNDVTSFIKKYPNLVKQIWCKEHEVVDYLSIADYGILLRDETITNIVASPVKFAEYLNVGLNIIISRKVGDFSKFVEVEGCGYVYDKKYIKLDSLSPESRKKNKLLVNKYFNKKSTVIQEKYNIILKNIRAC